MADTVTLYDAVSPQNIPNDVAAVAYYIDGGYAWSEAQLTRFANVPKKRITVFGSLDADVYDIEQGDGNAVKGGYWVSQKLKMVTDPNDVTLYCSRIGTTGYGWASCSMALAQRGLQGKASFWIADQTDEPHLCPGSVATQYADVANRYDTSLALASWLGIGPMPPTPTPAPKPTTSEDEMFPLNPTQEQFNACFRYVWYTLRKDPATANDFTSYWFAWNLPLSQKGFAQTWDLVVAQVHDTAGANLK